MKMKEITLAFSLLFLFSFSASAQNKSNSVAVETVSAAFKSDGCSLFPDGGYRDCCVEHDRAYFNGGSWTTRWKADKKLFKCVARKKGFEHKIIAPLMWLGVRAGGASWLPTSFRWGFGRAKSSNNSQ
jgi:hypothetical protein